MDPYHQVSLDCTQELYDFLYALMRPDEQQAVFAGIYVRVKDALKTFDLQSVQQHLTPSDN